jgi:hypothetical protein
VSVSEGGECRGESGVGEGRDFLRGRRGKGGKVSKLKKGWKRSPSNGLESTYLNTQEDNLPIESPLLPLCLQLVEEFSAHEDDALDFARFSDFLGDDGLEGGAFSQSGERRGGGLSR